MFIIYSRWHAVSKSEVEVNIMNLHENVSI